MDSIWNICFNFLWRGLDYHQYFPWIACKRLTIPKELGGWGLKYYPSVSRALAAKGILRLISSDGLWVNVTK